MLAPAHLVWGSAQNYHNRTAWKADDQGAFIVVEQMLFFSVLCSWVLNCFDLRPGAIIQYLKLNTPVFAETANYGHLGLAVCKETESSSV